MSKNLQCPQKSSLHAWAMESRIKMSRSHFSQWPLFAELSFKKEDLKEKTTPLVNAVLLYWSSESLITDQMCHGSLNRGIRDNTNLTMGLILPIGSNWLIDYISYPLTSTTFMLINPEGHQTRALRLFSDLIVNTTNTVIENHVKCLIL